MEIDPMDNDLDYPDPYKECKPLNYYDTESTEPCPKCGKSIKFDSFGVYCECGYKEQLAGD